MNSVTAYFCVVSLILEFAGFLVVVANYGSACIQAGEITTLVYFYLLLTYAALTSDLFYGTSIFFMKDNVIRDFLVFFQVFAMAATLVSGIAICIGLTFCGNAAQYFFLIGGLLTILAAIFHALAAIRVRKEISDSPLG